MHKFFASLPRASATAKTLVFSAQNRYSFPINRTRMQAIINKEARSKYEFLEEWDAGLVLSGAEVKSVKLGRMNLKGAYVNQENGEFFLQNAHISPYQIKNQQGYNPERPRKLLLTKSEIDRIQGKLNEKGLTIVPIRVYSKSGLIKVKIALARGLKAHDKREKLKKRDVDRSIARMMKHHAK